MNGPLRRRRPGPPAWPVFDSPRLARLAAALLLRRRAIAYGFGPVRCTREIDKAEGVTFERLNFDMARCRFRLSVWGDGVVWVRLCVPAPGRNAGWALRDSFHGNAGDLQPEVLVGLVEATPVPRAGIDPGREQDRLRAIWRPVGPLA